MVSCSLGDDEIPSYEDICNFTCDIGYELSGSDTRICQSDGSWSGNSAMCNKSERFFMCMHCNYIHVICIKHSMIHIVLYEVT